MSLLFSGLQRIPVYFSLFVSCNNVRVGMEMRVTLNRNRAFVVKGSDSWGKSTSLEPSREERITVQECNILLERLRENFLFVGGD